MPYNHDVMNMCVVYTLVLQHLSCIYTTIYIMHVHTNKLCVQNTGTWPNVHISTQPAGWQTGQKSRQIGNNLDKSGTF